MYMFPLFRWGNCRWLAAGHSLWVAWSGQYTVMSQPIWCTIDWLGTQQHRELGRVSRSRVLLWLVTSPQASPEPSNHRRGWVWVFFLALNRWFLHQLPSSQHPTSRPLSTDFWYHICGVRANGWGIQNALTSEASHVFSSYHASDQVTKTQKFHDTTSMVKHSVEQVTKLRKTQPLFTH